MKKVLFYVLSVFVLVIAACGNSEDASTEESTAPEEDTNEVAELEEENEELRRQLESEDADDAENDESSEELETERSHYEGQSESVEDEQEAELGEEEAESDDEIVEDETSETGSSTEEEPLSVGDTVEIEVVGYDREENEIKGKGNITVDNMVRGQEAIDFMTTDFWNYDDPDHENHEWALFDFTFELTEYKDDDTAYYIQHNFEVINDDGSMAPNEYAIIYEDEAFPFGERVIQGDTLEGKVARPVLKDEPFTLKYDDYEQAQEFYEVQ